MIGTSLNDSLKEHYAVLIFGSKTGHRPLDSSLRLFVGGKPRADWSPLTLYVQPLFQVVLAI